MGTVFTWTHPCFGKLPGETATVPSAFEEYLDVMEYKNVGNWHYLKSTTHTQYDQYGQNPIVTKEEFDYDNELHGLMTARRRLDADGTLISEQRFAFPDDFDLGIENYDALKARHIVALPVRIEHGQGNTQSGGKIISYNDLGQPTTIFEYKLDAKRNIPVHNPASLDKTNYEPKTELHYYDATNNIKQINSTDGVIRSYIWGHNNTKMVAFVTGAIADEIYVNSFEETGITGNAKTGIKYLGNNTFTIPIEDQPIGTNLKMSYWYWNIDHWEFSGIVDYNSTIITTGTGIDELRVFPEGVEITTYTYDLGKGLSSMTDTNNNASYYAYDNFGRLMEVKDQDGNILTKNKYHYSN